MSEKYIKRMDGVIQYFGSLGQENTGGDPCEAAGQPQVEPIRKALLQVCFEVLTKHLHTYFVLPHTCFFLFFLEISSLQTPDAFLPPLHWDVHIVLHISPPKGCSGELHVIRYGQNHPSPEDAPCALAANKIHDRSISAFIFDSACPH